jgi:Flp pilus assembly protein protease CpaA
MPDAPHTVVLIVLLAASAVSDILTAKVYNALTYPAIVLGFGLSLTGEPGVQASAMGFAIGGVLLACAWMFGGIGFGDAKLVMAVGALSGPLLTVHSLMYSALVMVALGIMTIIAAGRVRATALRLAAAAGLAKAPAGPPTLLPGGYCICLGTMWALLEQWNRVTLWDWAVGRFPGGGPG